MEDSLLYYSPTYYYQKCFEWCRDNDLPIDKIRIRVYQCGSVRLIRPMTTLMQFENGEWSNKGKVRAPHIRGRNYRTIVAPIVYLEYIVDPIDRELRQRLKARKRPGREEWVAAIPG